MVPLWDAWSYDLKLWSYALIFPMLQWAIVILPNLELVQLYHELISVDFSS